MKALISSEFLKLRTTRTFWSLTSVAVGLGILFTVGQLLAEDITTEADARSLLSNMSAASILIIFLGVIGSAGEYRHGTITPTFLGAPDRNRIVFAKAISYGLAGLAIAVIAAVAVLVIAIPWLSSDGKSFSSLGVSGGELAGILLGTLAMSALSGAFGAGVGWLVPNQLGAVMVVVVLVFILDSVMAAFIGGYDKWSLGGVSTAMSGANGDDVGYEDLFSPVVAGLIFFGYTVVLLAAAAAAVSRRDVS